MRDIFTLLLHAIVIIIRLAPPSGVRCCRIRLDATPRPDSESWSEAGSQSAVFGSHHRPFVHFADRSGTRSAICRVLQPSTLMHFHKMLTKQKYRLLFSSTRVQRPGLKGPTKELIDAVVEMKRRNRTWRCKRIAQQIALVFRVDIDKDSNAGNGTRRNTKWLRKRPTCS
jgi:hypothetical protein